MIKRKRQHIEISAEGSAVISKWLEVSFEKREIYYLGYVVKLTESESVILRRICEGDGKPVSATRILDDCFAGKPITRGNVNVHVCNINKKAHAISERDIISSVYGKGYRINPEH